MATSIIKGKHFGSRTKVENFSFPWTAPSDGIAVLTLKKNSTAGQVTYYVRSTDTYGECCISANLSANFQVTGVFPVRGGVTYSEEYAGGGLDSKILKFYPLI